MKLYLLKPIEDLKDSDNPWKPWNNKAFGFVVRAENEFEARKIAAENGGDENRVEDLITYSPWLSKYSSTCVELTNEGSQELIMKDFSLA